MFRMKHARRQWATALLVMASLSPAGAKPLIAIQFEGPRSLTALEHKAHAHYAVIKNHGPTKIIVLSVNGQTIGPPDFDGLSLMKGPKSDWSRWRNVLAAGQSTRVFAGRGPRADGPYRVSLEIEYALINRDFDEAHVREIISDPMKKSARQIVYRDGLPKNGPVYVSYASSMIAHADRRTFVTSSDFVLNTHPTIAALSLATPIQRFTVELPLLGSVIETSFGVFQVLGQTVRQLGQGRFDAWIRFARAMEARGVVSIRALRPPPDIPPVFTVTSEDSVPMMTSRVRAFNSVKRWYTFSVDATHVETFIDYVRRFNGLLVFDEHDGLILVYHSRELPVHGHFLPTVPTKKER